MSRKALIEAMQELARVMVLAVIPVAIAGLQDGHFDWRLIWTVAAIAGLRFIDKYLHTLGKELNDPKMIKGLTQF